MPPPAPSRWLLWLSFLGTPGLWLVHFLLAYGIAEAVPCTPLGAPAGGVRFTLVVGTGVFVLGSLALTFLAARVRRQALASRARYDDFLPRVGFIQGFLFTFALLLEGLAASLLPICG